MKLTEAELPRALEHVTYEWWMLWETTSWLDTHGRQPGAEWNAHVESAAIHLRNLAQFLAKSSDARDIRPGDFGVDWSCPTETEEALVDLFDRASKLVAHPSRERLKPERGWNLGELVPLVDAEMSRWFALIGHVPWTAQTHANVQGIAVRRAHWNRR